MQAADRLCRAVLYPRGFPDRVFNDSILMQSTAVIKDIHYAISVASAFLLQGESGTHKYGCRSAAIANARIEERTGVAPIALADAVHYIGYYSIKYEDVVSLQLKHHQVRVRHVPEEGQDEHFQIEFIADKSSGTAKQRRTERGTAVSILALSLLGPKRFVCTVDQNISDTLNAIDRNCSRGWQPA